MSFLGPVHRYSAGGRVHRDAAHIIRCTCLMISTKTSLIHTVRTTTSTTTTSTTILNRVAAPSMDGELVVMAGIMVVAQWWRPFGSLPNGADLWLSGFLESVEVFVSKVGEEERSWFLGLLSGGVVFDPGGSRA